ncbi:hypothetical protein B4966_09560 [Rhodocyclaceae bacterium]|nr:hypothetical protein B4966_09560 [Rhodocyclaceae bacterium]
MLLVDHREVDGTAGFVQEDQPGILQGPGKTGGFRRRQKAHPIQVAILAQCAIGNHGQKARWAAGQSGGHRILADDHGDGFGENGHAGMDGRGSFGIIAWGRGYRAWPV